jgi:thiol-disulfide isomerase/thioredoxin
VLFGSDKPGEVVLYNTVNQNIDTLVFSGNELTFYEDLDKPTLYLMFIAGINNRRPMNIVLSNKTTSVKFDSLKESVDGRKLADLYPNQPQFIEDPNKNRAFYGFHKEWVAFSDSIMSLSSSDSEELFEKRRSLYDSFVRDCEIIIEENKGEFIAATIIQYLINNNLLQLETIQSFYDYLAEPVKGSFMGLKIGEQAGKGGKLQAGYPAPEFDLLADDGQKYNLDNLKGKKVLLHFWSSTCAPCIKEAPELVELNNDYRDRLTVINVSLDTDQERWMKGIERAGVGEMINYSDLSGFKGKLAQDYAINVVPSYYLIDELGNIVMKGNLNLVRKEIFKSTP